MRFRLARLCRDFFRRNRQACLCCALVVLNMLILLFVWSIQKPEEPTVYGILYLGESVDRSDPTPDLERRTFMLHSTILVDALKDLATDGQKVPRRWPLINDRQWLEETLWVQPLENPALVRVGLAGGTPAEQAAIVNAVFRAYVRFFEEKEKMALDAKLSQDRRKIMKEIMDKVYHQPPELRRTREDHNRLVNQFLGDRLDHLKAARRQEIRAAVGKLPTIVEWAKVPYLQRTPGQESSCPTSPAH